MAQATIEVGAEMWTPNARKAVVTHVFDRDGRMFCGVGIEGAPRRTGGQPDEIWRLDLLTSRK